MKVEKEGERVGWMKVCPVLLLFLQSSPRPMDKILTGSDSVSRHSRTPIIEILSPTSSHTSTPTESILILPSDISPPFARPPPMMI